MQKVLRLLTAAIVCLWSAIAIAAPIEITDDTGRTLTFDKPLKRAVVFNRYNAEFIRSIAGMNVIVGVDSWVTRDPTYWPELKDGMLAGKNQREPNYEAIIALNPDIVIFPRNGNYEKAIKTLKPFDIPVAVLTGWDVLKHSSNMKAFGALFGQPERAAKLDEFYTKNMALLKERLEGVEPKKVYLEEKTPYRSVLKGSGWHDMIEAAGGINIFGKIDIAQQPKERGSVHNHEVDPEGILKAQPVLIVKLQPGSYPLHPKEFSEAFFKELAERPGFDELPAMKNDDVYHINYYQAGGCSKMIGSMSIAKWLHPELFKDVDPAALMKTWLEDFQGVKNQGQYWTKITDVTQAK